MITYKEYAKISKNSSSEIRVFLSLYKGNAYANIRTFVCTADYSGPTPKGIVLHGGQLVELLELLEAEKEKIQEIAPELDSQIIGEVSLSSSTILVVRLLNNRFTRGETCIDFRLRLSSKSYSGWTKKGFLIKIADWAIFKTALVDLASDLSKTSVAGEQVESSGPLLEIILKDLKNFSPKT